MKINGNVFLGTIAITMAAGCASGSVVDRRPRIDFASPSPTIPDCRNQGSYNRAANLCVSGGGP